MLIFRLIVALCAASAMTSASMSAWSEVATEA